MPNNESTTCPRCRSEFDCKKTDISMCHCSKVQLTQEQRAYLAEHWQGCLCYQCLVEVKASIS